MEVIRGIEHVQFPPGESFVTIGIFDGVHIGHQRIIRTLKKMAGRKKRTVLVTFSPHPVRFFSPGGRFYEITSIEERIELIRPFSLDYLVVADFDEPLSEMAPKRFIKEVLLEKFRARGVVVGYDFLFGKGRKGDTDLLKREGERRGFSVQVVEPVTFMGSIVSSTRIRELVLSGRVREASLFLGRHFLIRGKVVHGAGRGKSLGYPTANLAFSQGLLPLPGVYAVRVLVDKSLKRGVCSIGFNPTFGEKSLRVEVYIFDFEEDIYGEDISLYLIDRIRDERKFAGGKELVSQIKSDIRQAQKILGGINGASLS